MKKHEDGEGIRREKKREGGREGGKGEIPTVGESEGKLRG